MAFEPSLTEEFSSLVKPEEAQSESFFKGKVREETGVVGETYHFKRRSHNEAIIGLPRGAAVQTHPSDFADIECKPLMLYHREFIAKYDMLRRTVEYRKGTIKEIQDSLARAYDKVVNDALYAASGSLTSLSVTDLNDAGWMAADAAFAGYTRSKREMYAMIRKGGRKDTLADTNIKNNFWLNNRIMAEGEMPVIYGFKPTTWDKLTAPTPATNRRCWFWIKDCVGVAQCEGIDVRVDYDEDLVGFKVTGTMFMNAAVIDPTGIRYADINDA